jgi:hypothetical protein
LSLPLWPDSDIPELDNQRIVRRDAKAGMDPQCELTFAGAVHLGANKALLVSLVEFIENEVFTG